MEDPLYNQLDHLTVGTLIFYLNFLGPWNARNQHYRCAQITRKSDKNFFEFVKASEEELK